MLRVIDKLKRHQIPHYVWTEPDFDLGLTAVATVPLWGEQREVLANYRVWSEHNARGTAQAVCSFTGDPGANSGVVSNSSIAASKAEGVGENPTA